MDHAMQKSVKSQPGTLTFVHFLICMVYMIYLIRYLNYSCFLLVIVNVGIICITDFNH